MLDYTLLINIWFVLWCVIWAIYLVADSFPLGAGMLAAFLPKNMPQTLQIARSVGPFWGGNQVWLILAAGGTFAAFPLIFSKMFTWLYIPMMLLLVAIILRGICIELIYHDENEKLQQIFRYGWALGSLLITVVLGVAFTNFFRGMVINADYVYEGTLLGLFSVHALLGALLFVLLFLTSGALWVAHKTAGDISVRAESFGKKSSVAVAAVALIYILALFNTDGFAVNYNAYPILYVIPAIAVVFALACILLTWKKSDRPLFAFFANIGTIFFGVATGVVSLYPYILKSTINPEYGVSIFAGASSQLTLSLMFYAALIFVPIVLIYQLWSYTKFKEKIPENASE
ncbi:Cytochrome bd-I ubiquinol oxidase subunit 2 [Methanimicrococcus sp. At1]|uniref:Cytochrome bd-I ubiquinol oxidase subunit 2 n=1 Tax=Methanimicrococcus hacksteinii TaxID=3028293 RepID=A0ABU3VQT2_9EURY|nr:cytochrome d ubiquinol oxidase subunit II [Methanimicrococcus sp. At1]MDV0445670.1 Cytochrome bd-I ubiquinol oxidase subunit 2 [Methanimicrococcus sp. At1]